MTRDDNNKRSAGGDRAQRLANMRNMKTNSTARTPYQSSSIDRRSTESRRAQHPTGINSGPARGTHQSDNPWEAIFFENMGPTGKGSAPDRPSKNKPSAENRFPVQGTPSMQKKPTAGNIPAQRKTNVRPSMQNRPSNRSRPSTQGKPPTQRKSAVRTRPSAKSGASAHKRPILQQGNVRRDFDREAARRRIEQRRRKEEIKKRRKAVKQKKKQKTARSRKRRRSRRLRVLTMALAVFLLFFYVWPHMTDRVGETDEAQPVAATQPPSEKQEPETQESQVETNARDTSSEYLVLVNKDHALQADDEPKDLVDGKPAVSGGSKYQQLRKPAAAAFKKLAAGAKEEGYTIKVTSGYRPYAYQKQLFERYVNKDGRYSAEQYSAEPGHSEHQTGLVADVSSPSVNYNLVQAYGSTEEGKWLAKNAHKYGFIIRFLKGKEDITGYEYEPWHIRYVGKDAAKEIYKQDLTLEEYLGQD